MYFFDRVFYGNTLKVWLITLVIAVVVYVALILLKKGILKRLVALGERIRKDAYDLAIDNFKNIKHFFILILSLYIASQYLLLTPKATALIKNIMVIVFLIQVAIWGNGSISFWLERYTTRKMKEDAATVTMVSAFSYVARILFWALLALIALDNLGVNVRTLIAGVGIGGIALALGVQNILKDLFASLSIATDKPFVYGDFIASGDFQGTVEQVGLKTTRLRSLTGEQIIVSNSDLLQSRIRNYQRIRSRRGLFTLGVTYQTPHEKLAKIPEMLREIIEKYEKTRIEHIHLTALGASSINFETVYWIDDPDNTLFLNTQQSIYLAIIKRFEEEGIEFAYPTQSLFVEKLPTQISA